MKPKNKIISGIILIIISIITFFIGRTKKQKIVRVTLFIISGLSLFSGTYLLYSGLDDLAVGVVGQYVMGGDYVQELHYKSEAEFKKGILGTYKTNDKLRRLHFQCSDFSKDFTVYTTKIGILGIPSESVKCKNGSYLLKYNS